MRRLVAAVGVAAMVLAACSDDDPGATPTPTASSASPQAAGPTGVVTWEVAIDAPPASGGSRQYAAYYPSTIAVRPGDTINFAMRNQAHTVTLGVKADGSNIPPLITPKGLNPAVFGPCVTAAEPSTTLTLCPPSALPVGTAWNGTGYWNSGLLVGDPQAPNNKTSVKIGADVATGTYPYVCMLHPLMRGSINVVATDTERKPAAEVAAQGATELTAHQNAASALAAPAAQPGQVTAGWGDNVVAVLEFSPTDVAIKAGETVTWKVGGVYEPHTVSFNAGLSSPEDPKALNPFGVKSGGSLSSTTAQAHSGFIGPAPGFPTDTFSLTFPKAGSYVYTCVLHPGMAGKVTVT